MTGFILAWAVGVIAIAGLALALPCEACRRRRERMRRAFDLRRKGQDASTKSLRPPY